MRRGMPELLVATLITLLPDRTSGIRGAWSPAYAPRQDRLCTRVCIMFALTAGAQDQALPDLSQSIAISVNIWVNSEGTAAILHLLSTSH